MTQEAWLVGYKAAVADGAYLSDRQAARLRSIERCARAVLACGVGNLSGDKYKRRVQAFDDLDDALDGSEGSRVTA